MLRTPLVLLFGSLIVGCTVGDPGTGGDDDSTGGAVCGDGVKEGNEACDDGNAANGDGCSSTCTVEALPSFSVSVDKPTISTELRTSHMITVSLAASGGFSGPVALAGSVVNAAGDPIPGWTVAFDNASVNVPADGTGTAIATLTVPSTNKGLSGTVKIDATATGVAAKQATSAVTALNQITFPMTLTGGQCDYPAAGTVNVTIGTKLRWLNNATSNVTIHVGGGTANGVNHQADPGTAPNAAYEQTVSGTPAGTITWYCHAPGPTVNNRLLQPVAP